MPFVQMIDKNLPPNRLHAIRFGLWIAMASICMMFGAFTSAYLVRKPAGNWYEFKLPEHFFFSTLIIILSSIFIEWAYQQFKKGNERNYQYGVLLGFIFGIGFLIAQVFAWKALFAQGITINLNVSGSFLYLISGIHALHVLGGIGALLVSVITAYTFDFDNSPNRKLRFDLVRQYWHFVDVLWIYLLVFLIIQ
ncbi:MAG: cytochrome c oxidase subunit 3 [Bacteroidota bacterium]|nr:cytochrome c oxidase subunit 3 [Bacteroidota bacterium]